MKNRQFFNAKFFPSYKKAFTLLEVIIVIIIIGVLTSLALPRLSGMIEGSRAAEALANIATMRASMERCFLKNGSYLDCCMSDSMNVYTLDIGDLNSSPNSHFDYSACYLGGDPNAYYIMVERNARDASPEHVGKCIMMGYNITFTMPDDEMCDSVPLPDEVAGNNFYWYAADIYKGFVPNN